MSLSTDLKCAHGLLVFDKNTQWTTVLRAMALPSSLSSIVVPLEGNTLRDDTSLFLSDHQGVIFIAIPDTEKAIKSVADDLRCQLRQITLNNKVFLIADTRRPVDLDAQSPTLVELRENEHIFDVLEAGCRENVHRIMAAVHLQCHGGPFHRVARESVADLYANTPSQTPWHQSVATYDRELAHREKSDRYKNAVNELRETLAGVQGNDIGFSLDGTLVGRNQDAHHPLAHSSYVRRPFAEELLEALSEKNTISLCTGVSEQRIAMILQQTRLNLPDGINIISAENIRAVNQAHQLTDLRVKVPTWHSLDLLVDDKTDFHMQRAKDADLKEVDELQFTPVRTFHYGRPSSLETHVEETDLLGTAHAIAERAKQLQRS